MRSRVNTTWMPMLKTALRRIGPKVALGVAAIVCTSIACQEGTFRSGTSTSRGQAPLSPVASVDPKNSTAKKQDSPTLSSEARGINIVQTSYLYSIANPKVPQEKCWYLADRWGQNFQGGTSPQVLATLRPLTTKSVTPAEVKTALQQLQSQERSWQDAVRFVLAGCAVAVPFATTPIGAVAVAVCGATGTLAEKSLGDRVSSADRAEQLITTGDKTSVEGQRLIEVLEAALRGKVGSGSLNCATSLAEVRKQREAQQRSP